MMEIQAGKKPVYTFVDFIDLNPDEVLLVWKWRNHDSVRKWMYDTSVIPFQNHLKFLENLKKNRAKSYFMVKRNNIPTGVFSIEALGNQTGEFGFYLAPEFHGLKLSTEYYYHILGYVFYSQHFEKITANTLVGNKAINLLNEMFGYVILKTEKAGYGIGSEFYRIKLDKKTWLEAVSTNDKIKQRLHLSDTKNRDDSDRK
jgi:UDP-4-amino-4,6-dideoxy-N-acetyl-beta-L-altrosamine N-acetyltransferase